MRTTLEPHNGYKFPARELAGGLLLWALLIAVYAVYIPALDAPWQFDDAPNLRELSNVHDSTTAMDFVVGGISSELGRPLALAAFLPNAADWPSNPAGFRYVNILLHMLNGLLVAWLAVRIGGVQPQTTNRAIWPALVLTALWVMHPFLATTSLFIVQRMALLAATFTLLGLLAFVHGRSLLAQRPAKAYAWMSGGLTIGASVGMLAKENAALLPFFAAALSTTVLAHLPTGDRRIWRAWQLVFFVGPAALLFTYAASHWSSIVLSYAARPFSLEERVLSQPIILWDYIRQLVVPDVALMGPFHDDITAQTGFTVLSVLAISGWASILVAAVALRRRLPWLALAVFWFLAGHLLESTVFNLEMYFEHRNYLPSLGPLGALVALAWSSRKLWPRVVVTAAAGLFAVLLWQVTTLWGHPRLAAERWAYQHPTSSRATEFLSQRYALMGDHYTALRVIQRGSRANPRASDLAVQTLQLSCSLVGAEELRAQLTDLIARAPHLDPSPATVSAIAALRVLVHDRACPGLEQEGIVRLITALLQNPLVHHHGLIRHHLHHQLAEIYMLRGNLDGAVRNLQAAFSARPNPQTAQLLAVTLASAGLYREAVVSIDNALSRPSTFTLGQNKWETALKPLRDILAQHASSYQRNPAGSK